MRLVNHITSYNFEKNLFLLSSSSSSLILDFRENGSRGVGLVITGSEYLKSYIRPGGRQAAGGYFLSNFTNKFMSMNFF